MSLRRSHSIVVRSTNGAQASMTPLRCYHMPGWKTKISTKDARTREQREADRKVRQIEKLPRPVALHDFQYPYEKTILSDTMFQYPVYENELDTPHLFNLTPPPDFFIFWNVSDFDRTAYPPLPEIDHRTIVPSRTSPAWAAHRQRTLAYLRKHEILPHFLPHVRQDVNLSVVFPGTYATRARLDEETGEALPPPPPVTELCERNFWMTAHCGNFIELTDVQHPPSIFLWDESAATEAPGKTTEAPGKTTEATEAPGKTTEATEAPGGTGKTTEAPGGTTEATEAPGKTTEAPGGTTEAAEAPGKTTEAAGGTEAAGAGGRAGAGWYTLLVVSPDFPYRVPPAAGEASAAGKGCFLHYMVANLPATAAGLASHGDVVVPYVPPLPTEGAGTTRHVCALFRQSEKVEDVQAVGAAESFPFEARSAYRMHAPHRTGISAAAAEALAAAERVLSPEASAVTFFQTKWDIQVQEFYERCGRLEPALPVDDEIEAILAFHAKKPEELRVRARHRPDGATNVGDDPNFWAQSEETRMMDGTMRSLWSRRTAMGKNGVPVTQRH